MVLPERRRMTRKWAATGLHAAAGPIFTAPLVGPTAPLGDLQPKAELQRTIEEWGGGRWWTDAVGRIPVGTLSPTQCHT